MKTCSKCGLLKPRVDFSAVFRRGGSVGTRPECRKCQAAYNAKWHVRNRERENAKMRRARWARASTIPGRQKELLDSAAERAALKRLPIDLDLPWLEKLWDEQGGCCKLTGIPFDLSRGPVDGEVRRRHREFAPSLDRIIPELGYVKTNVELVCWHLNAAFGEYGRPAFDELVRAYLERKP